MTEDDLKAIEAREGAATKGPWHLGKFGRNTYPIWGSNFAVLDANYMGGTEQAEKNGLFAAHARQDIPALTAHIREQEKRIAELEELVSERFAGNLASAMETKMAEIDHEWQPIETAPQDGTEVWVHVAAREGLPSFECKCAYHPDAGWCADEIRDVTHWNPHHD